MIRFMIDTDTPAAEYPACHLFATYADLIGTQAELAALRARFPQSVIVLIDRHLGDPLGLATVIDIEVGAWDPADEARITGWLNGKLAAGHRPSAMPPGQSPAGSPHSTGPRMSPATCLVTLLLRSSASPRQCSATTATDPSCSKMPGTRSHPRLPPRMR